MSLLRRLSNQIYPDKVLIAIKWIGFIVCLVLLAVIIIHGWIAYDLYGLYVRVDGEVIDPIPKAKVDEMLRQVHLRLQDQGKMAIFVMVYLVFHMVYLRLAENAKTR